MYHAAVFCDLLGDAMNIIELAKQAGLKRHQEQAPGIDGVVGSWADLEAFAALIKTQEREACAGLAERRLLIDKNKNRIIGFHHAVKEIAADIRARGTT